MQEGVVCLDLHQQTQHQARILIDSRLKSLPKSVYRLRVIHGYQRGTQLRDMVRSRYKNHPRVIRIELGLNPGSTDLVLRELY